MTTHAAVWCPGDEKQGPRLFWASDRKFTFGDGRRFDGAFYPATKHEASPRLWIAGAGTFSQCRAVGKLAHSCETAVEVVEEAARLKAEDQWGDQEPEFLACDQSGLYLINGSLDMLRVRPWRPVAIGSGERYAEGACLALLPQIPTDRTDWAAIVKRAVLVAGECDEATEGVECGVWTPGPVVYELSDLAVPA
jgi:ATP-dependent protease HslVU (ClpYQ) peptidase subunit